MQAKKEFLTGIDAKAGVLAVSGPVDDVPGPAVGEKRLRVACVIDDLGTGGAQRIVSVMARELPVHGVELIVISLGERDAERAALEDARTEIHVLPAARIGSPRRLLDLVRLLRRIEPDVVHTHLLASHIVGGIACRLLRVPLIATLHNVDPHPRFAGTRKRSMESFCLRSMATRLVAVGPAVAESNAHRLAGRRIETLANPLSSRTAAQAACGADAWRQQRADARERVAAMVGAEPTTCLFLTVGRLAAEKGWPAFLEVFDELRRSHPDCRLVSVGDGPMHESITREIAARGLDEHVHLLGRRDDVATFYLGSDAFVLNSTIEGLPMSLLEAMASALPVIATRVGDIEFATGDEVARLVAPGRVEEMTGALRDFMDDPAAADRGLAGRSRVLRRFGLDDWTRSLARLYREASITPSRSGASASPCRIASGEPSQVQPFRLVEFVDGLKTGGAQALIALRARNARRMGYRIDLICLGTCSVVSAELAANVEAIHHFPSRHVFEPGRIVQICRLLRKLRPDAIQTHLRTSNTVGALCGRLTGIPVVGTLHITFPELGLEHARRDWAESWALRLGARRVVAVGPSVADTHRARLGGKPIVTIPNPVELPTDALDPARRKSRARASLGLPFDPDGSRIILTVGRLTRVKGAPDCLQVLSRIHRTSPDVKLLIVGDGELAQELERSIESLGLSGSAFLLGRSERVPELMAASDLFLLSSHAEGLPLVLLEAMSLHLPIVATGVGDVPWLLGDGEFGALVEPGDTVGAARAVQVLLDSPGRAESVAALAHSRVREAFSVDRWLDDIDLVLRSSARRPAIRLGRRGTSTGAEPASKVADRCTEAVLGSEYRDVGRIRSRLSESKLNGK